MSEKANYRQILKSTTLFGGVQVVNIIISLIRSKAIALLIGPAGIGVAGLLNSALNFISGLTSLGLETSAVKYISQHNVSENKKSLYTIVSVLRKAVWATGTCGAFAMAITAPWLSKITFADSGHTMWFVYLSISLLFRQLTVGELAILQGLQKLQWLAKANLLGNAFGLLLSLPLYFFLGIDAILPSIIISSLLGLCWVLYYSRKAEVQPIRVTASQVLEEGKGMLKLGIIISISGLITTLVAYIIQIYITSVSGLIEVGYYHAGFTLLNSYAALVLSAMATDYLPRLLSISEDDQQLHSTIGKQSKMGILLIIPIILLFIVGAPLILRILFSAEFMSILLLVRIGIIGMLFRAASWPMSYIFIAKDDLKSFVVIAIVSNAVFLFMHIIGYYYYGLTGIGIAYLSYYILYFIGIKAVLKYKYGFNFPYTKIMMAGCIICGAIFWSTSIGSLYVQLLVQVIIILLSVYLADRLTDLRAKIKRFFNK